MEKYTVEIEFLHERHCSLCPLREYENDRCKMQIDEETEELKDFETWEEQMINCPLVKRNGKIYPDFGQMEVRNED